MKRSAVGSTILCFGMKNTDKALTLEKYFYSRVKKILHYCPPLSVTSAKKMGEKIMFIN